MNLFDLTGRTALVTGACGLIGKHHCEALHEAGANVVMLDIDEAKCEALAASIGERHLGIGVDVTSKASLIAARDRILAKYGTVDILINNAAINDMFENPALAAEQSQFEHYPVEMFEKSLDVNVTGVFFGWTSFLYLVASLFFSIGLHPVGARWIQEHFVVKGDQETYSYYGPLNFFALNVGYHNEHHDFPNIPWNRLPQLRKMAPEYYDTLHYHTSWSKLLLKFLFDKKLGLYSRVLRADGVGR